MAKWARSALASAQPLNGSASPGLAHRGLIHSSVAWLRRFGPAAGAPAANRPGGVFGGSLSAGELAEGIALLFFGGVHPAADASFTSEIVGGIPARGLVATDWLGLIGPACLILSFLLHGTLLVPGRTGASGDS